MKELNKKFIESFEIMRDEAELKALSNLSLKQELTKEQSNRMIVLGKKLGYN